MEVSGWSTQAEKSMWAASATNEFESKIGR